MMVTLDSTDPEPLARWWAERFGASITGTNDGWFVTVAGGTLPVTLGFQSVPEVTPGKNRLHFDLDAVDRQAAVAEFLTAGATLVTEHTVPDGSFAWTVLEDPQGNQFCIAQH